MSGLARPRVAHHEEVTRLDRMGNAEPRESRPRKEAVRTRLNPANAVGSKAPREGSWRHELRTSQPPSLAASAGALGVLRDRHQADDEHAKAAGEWRPREIAEPTTLVNPRQQKRVEGPRIIAVRGHGWAVNAVDLAAAVRVNPSLLERSGVASTFPSTPRREPRRSNNG